MNESARQTDRRLRVLEKNRPTTLRDITNTGNTELDIAPTPANPLEFLPYRKAKLTNAERKGVKFGEARFLVDESPYQEDLKKRPGGCPRPVSVEVVEATPYIRESSNAAPIQTFSIAEDPEPDDLIVVLYRQYSVPFSVTSGAGFADPYSSDLNPEDPNNIAASLAYFLDETRTVRMRNMVSQRGVQFLGNDVQEELDHQINGVFGGTVNGPPLWSYYSSWYACYEWGDRMPSRQMWANQTVGSGLTPVIVYVLRNVKRYPNDEPGLSDWLIFPELTVADVANGSAMSHGAEIKRIYARDYYSTGVTNRSPANSAGSDVIIGDVLDGALAIDVISHRNLLQDQDASSPNLEWRHDFYDAGDVSVEPDVNFDPRPPFRPSDGDGGPPPDPAFDPEWMAVMAVSHRPEEREYRPKVPLEGSTRNDFSTSSGRNGRGNNDGDTLVSLIFEAADGSATDPIGVGPIDHYRVDLPKPVEPVRGIADLAAARARQRDDWGRSVVIALEDIPAGDDGFFAVAGKTPVIFYDHNPAHTHLRPWRPGESQHLELPLEDQHVTGYLRWLRRVRETVAGAKAVLPRPEILESCAEATPIAIERRFRELTFYESRPTPTEVTLTADLLVADNAGTITQVTADFETLDSTLSAGDTVASGDLRSLWPPYDPPRWPVSRKLGVYGTWTLDTLGFWRYVLNQAAFAEEDNGSLQETWTLTLYHETGAGREFARCHPFLLANPAATALEPWVATAWSDNDFRYKPQPGLNAGDGGYVAIPQNFDPVLGRVPGSVASRAGEDATGGLCFGLAVISEHRPAGGCC